jgi:D-arabinose 5-phosphate isomerase GutQ
MERVDGQSARTTFMSWIERLPEEVGRSAQVLSDHNLAHASSVLVSARRVFCVGSGSSVATALHIASELTARGKFSAFFVGTSQVLSLESLDASDVVVLVSQGYNRSDALIVAGFVRNKGAQLVVLTASNASIDAEAVLRFTPTAEEERLFCRPCGAVTSYLLGAALVEACCGEEMPPHAAIEKAIRDARSRDLSDVAQSVHAASLVIVLGSGRLMPALHNVALSLREGAAKVAEFYEIEYYAHGQYAPHFKHREAGGRVVYLLPYSEADGVSAKAVERISPLFERTASTYYRLPLVGDSITAAVGLLVLANNVVGRVIAHSGYDMNSPTGKEENRGFQLVPADYYER